jgi:hypothetical protein
VYYVPPADVSAPLRPSARHTCCESAGLLFENGDSGYTCNVTSRIAVIAIDALDPRRVAEFWTDVLGWHVVEEDGDVISIGPQDVAWPTIDVVRVPERKTVKNRLHLDLRADGNTAEQEVKRLIEFGARPVDVGQGPDVSWTVLADPEGNEFCILSRSVQDVTAGR